MHINWQLRQLNLKIVYYGPALSGKTTNLEKIHARIEPQRRSELISLKTNEDRTLFFDFFQLELNKIGGLTPKIQLYTVPGQTYYDASRKLVLRGADGVVFVADSTPNRLQANRASWSDLDRHLRTFNLSLQELPVVVQCNKQDAPGSLSPERLAQELGLQGFPLLTAAAIKSEGVFETFKTVTMKVMTSVQKQLN